MAVKPTTEPQAPIGGSLTGTSVATMLEGAASHILVPAAVWPSPASLVLTRAESSNYRHEEA